MLASDGSVRPSRACGKGSGTPPIPTVIFKGRSAAPSRQLRGRRARTVTGASGLTGISGKRRA